MAVITVSRQFGAGARTIGERLAKRLGYRYVHEDMIKDVAKKVKVSQDQVVAIERRGTTKLMKFLDKVVKTDFIDRLVSDKYGVVDEERYVGAVKAIVEDLYEGDNVVIIGRGSQFILKDFENAWHVFLVADLKHRIRFLMDKYHLMDYEAEKAIKNAMAVRTRFLSFYADKEFHDDPLSYDLILNLNRVSMKKPENLIIDLISDKK